MKTNEYGSSECPSDVRLKSLLANKVIKIELFQNLKNDFVAPSSHSHVMPTTTIVGKQFTRF